MYCLGYTHGVSVQGIQEQIMLTFTVVIEPDEDMFHAYAPVLPGCHTFGATIDEALADIREAIELYVESLREDGEPIPVEQEPLLITRLPIVVAA
jgi:predicted RNase H-like HicB family nuclease